MIRIQSQYSFIFLSLSKYTVGRKLCSYGSGIKAFNMHNIVPKY